jgi:Protein of unknown function (DUF4058)
MPYPFPGMNPWLENPELWRGVQQRLIIASLSAAGNAGAKPLSTPSPCASLSRAFSYRCFPMIKSQWLIWVRSYTRSMTGCATA